MQYEGESILNQSKRWIVKLLLPTDPTITADNPTFYDPTLQERVEALRDGVTHRIQRASEDSATGSSTGTPRHEIPPRQRSIKADLDELYNIRLALEAVEQREEIERLEREKQLLKASVERLEQREAARLSGDTEEESAATPGAAASGVTEARRRAVLTAAESTRNQDLEEPSEAEREVQQTTLRSKPKSRLTPRQPDLSPEEEAE